MKKRILLAAAACLLLAGSGVGSLALSSDDSTAAVNWTNTGGPLDESGFSRLEQINAKNAGKLGLEWALDLEGEVTLEATPIAVDGVLYFSGSYGKVYAVDAVAGKVLWTYDPQIWKRTPSKFRSNFGVNRGVVYADGRIFLGALDGYLTALDAKTGQELWKTQTVPEKSIHTVTGAPRVFNGKVIIGNAGADANMRGFVTAYDQKTGQQVWRFYTTPAKPGENGGDPVMEMAAKTWTGEYWKVGGGGGTVWNGITFDPELNRIYLGVGNAGPYNPRARNPGGGDNLFVASIVALDADTGKYVWHYQQNPNEAWDYKATANMISATLMIDGKPRKVLMQQPTNGFFYVLDRETGKLISAEKSGKVTWAERIDLATGRPVEAKNIRYETGETIMWPSMIGTHNWQAMSFNPKTGLVYIPHMQLGARYTTNVKPGDFAFGGMSVSGYKDPKDPNDGKGALLAWDPVRQKAAWKAPLETIWNGGTLTTGGNLVFQGAGDGWFRAYNASSGKPLWKFNAGLGIVGAPISYAVNGKQYVSVLVGYGGTTAALSDFLNVGWKYGAQPRRLLTFALDGKATLAPSPGPDMQVHAVDDPSIQIDEKDVAVGRQLSIACIACHGVGLKAAGSPAPDLRESQIALSQDGLKEVLKGGALAERGMPQFDFTDGQIRQLHAYIRATAREALGTRKASDEAPLPSRF
ncbi:PQQ-dependent dehydrogenase, methanol/ethanol family [Phenylobacterium sp. LjRoot219]|uniref:PQQ-dependent dehydrogenase, methanol/ethanol family n=1 Tax=Phenylobacterium sp. LjRoot219 TaxID=3342283 RepID=UPI003ED11951